MCDNMFRLKENDGIVHCFIDGTLKYLFIRNKNKNGYWEAFNVKEGKTFGESVDSDKYRYDLAERLDIKIR